VFEKDREDRLDRLYEKLRSIIDSAEEEYPTCNKKTED
jgi:hypothetical protein